MNHGRTFYVPEMRSPDFPHAHLCTACNLVWFHDPMALASPRLHDRAHHCPACGAEVRIVNVTHTRSMYCNAGKDPFR